MIKLQMVRSTVMVLVAMGLFSVSHSALGMEAMNLALGRCYDFSRLPESIINADKLLTDGIKDVDGKNSLSWAGSDEVMITVDLARLCKIYSARLDISNGRDIRASISQDNNHYTDLPIKLLPDGVMLGGAGAGEGQFLKIAVKPDGNLKCSELEVTGYAIGAGMDSNIGLGLWQAMNKNRTGEQAALPEGVSWDIGKAYKEQTPTRERICLNGIWKFQPVSTEQKFPPFDGWNDYTRVPFMLANGAFHEHLGFDVYDKNLKATNSVNGVLVKDFKQGWWKREFTVPEVFRNRQIYLKVDYIGLYGRVYLNGQFIGEGYINRENRYEVGGVIRWDQPNELIIFASGDSKSQRVFSRGAASLSSLFGDVWLESLPKQAYIKNTQIATSTRKQELKLLMDISGKGKFIVSGEIYDKSGKVKELPEKKVQAKGGRVEYVYSWKDAQCWSVENPHLYDLVVYLKDDQGNIIDQAYRDRFGFREFWSEGGDYYLNGIKTRLFLNSGCTHTTYSSNASDEKSLAEIFGELKKMGFNSIRYTVRPYEEKILRIADEVGLLIIIDAAEITFTGGFETDAAKGLDLWQQWNRSPKAQEQTRDDMKELIARLGNHPSLVMWLMTFNSLDHQWTMNPYKIDGSYVPYPPEGKSIGFLTKEKVDVALKLEDILYEYDANHRPIFHHSCGNVGQAITVNGYFNFGFPEQEWEDWPMLWSKKKLKPLINTEDDYPSFAAWYGRSDWWNISKDRYEPYHIEYAAMYWGDDSYRVVSPAYIHTWNKRKSMSDYDYGVSVCGWVDMHSPQSMMMGCMLAHDIPLAWRTYGVSGIGIFLTTEKAFGVDMYKPTGEYPDLTAPGAKPSITYIEINRQKPTEIFYALQKSQAKVLVYIGGPGDNFTAKDHSYFSREKPAKQVIILNDSEQDIQGKVDVRLKDPEGYDQEVLSKRVAVKAGEQGRETMTWETPDVKVRKGYSLEVTLTCGKEVYKDIFPVTVFPREKANCAAKILLIDDVGITGKALKEAGIAFDKVEKARTVEGYKIVVIGREYGKKGGLREAAQLDWRGAFERGISLVVFEQAKIPDGPLTIDHNDTSFMGLKLREGSYRYAFIRDRGHPILAGLEGADLINWRGESDLMEAYPEPAPITENAYPERFWKLGNKGIVSTYGIEKPSKGSFRVIADAGFDLSDAVLLEWLEGKSRIIFCQADVSARYGKDPVATKIIHNIFKYCEISPERIERMAMYLGGDKGIKLLDTLGVKYGKMDKPEALTTNTVLMIGEMAESQTAGSDAGVKKFITNGGAALYLPVATGQTYTTVGCPPGLSFQKQRYYMPTNEWPNMDLVRGLGIGDLFVKDYCDVTVPVNRPAGSTGLDPAVIASVPYGQGRCIFMGLDPAMFEKQYPYQKVIRDWNTILANLGIDSANRMQENVHLFLSRIVIELAGEWKFKTDPPNVGDKEGWAKKEYDDKDWKALKVPGFWEDQGITEANPYWKPVHEKCDNCDPKYFYNGYAWYRKQVFIPEYARGVQILKVGGIDDGDETYLNGTLIGKMGGETSQAYCTWREYEMPASVINYGGDNVIAIKVYDLHGKGGIRGDPVRIISRTTNTSLYVDKNLPVKPYFFYRW